MIRIVYLLFIFSGFIGLIYEAVWSRYLKLFLGHSSYGQLLTLTIYMGGLGLGAMLGGRLVKRLRNPFLAYAAIEFLVGLAGFFYHEIYLFSTGLFYTLNQSLSLSAVFYNPVKILISVAGIGPVCILLGMTFPCLAIGVMRIAGDQGRKTLPRLYFTNSLGAAAGILFTSYYLIPNLGTVGTLTVAATGNTLLALCFYGVSRYAAKTDFAPNKAPVVKPPEARQPSPAYRLSPNRMLLFLLFVCFTTGFASFIYEIGWIRLLGLMLGSSTHAFDIMVSAFILGLAAGGLFAQKILRRGANALPALGWVQIAMGISALGSIYLYKPFFLAVNSSHLVLQRTDSAYALQGLFNYMLSLFLMFPACFFAGITLPVLTYVALRISRDEKFTGSIYGWNTLGAISGAVLAGLVLMPLFQLKFTIAAGAFIDIALGFAVFSVLPKNGSRHRTASLVTAIAVIPVFLVQFNPGIVAGGFFRTPKTDISGENILVRDGRTATISFHSYSDMNVIKTNGKADASLSNSYENPTLGDAITQAALAIVPISVMNKNYDAAIIGMGSGMTAHHLLGDDRLRKLDLIEIEKEMVRLAKGFLPFNQRAYEDPRVNLIIEDAKTFFHRGNHIYDVIISEPSNPWVSGVSGLFTEEFYRHIKPFLAEDGLLVQWMHLYEFNSDLLLNILKAMDNIFSRVEIYQVAGTEDILILAGDRYFALHEEPLFDQPRVKGDLDLLQLEPDFFGEKNFIVSNRTLKPILRHYQPNSDFFPLVDNGAEKAFFLGSDVDLFDFLSGSLAYYQEIFEEKEFHPFLGVKGSIERSCWEDPVEASILRHILPMAESTYNWEQTEQKFVQLASPCPTRERWDTSRVVSLYREMVFQPSTPPEYRLRFQLLDNIYRKNREAITAVIEEILEELHVSDLSLQYIRAMAIKSILAERPDLYERVFAKFIAGNDVFSKYEKMLLEDLRNSGAVL